MRYRIIERSGSRRARLTPGSSAAEPLTRAQFRYRWVTKTGASDWSQPFVLPLVK